MDKKFEILGNNLRSARKARSLSQEKLGELANISSRYIGEIENGDVNPSFDVLYKLKSVLGISFNVFYAPITDNDKDDIQELTNLYRACPSTDVRRMMIATTRALADESQKLEQERKIDQEAGC